MKSVYEAPTTVEAYMIHNLLQQEGIDSQVLGEHLQGGIGEMAPLGIIRIMVPEGSHAKARKIIAEWEAIEIENEPPVKKLPKSSNGWKELILGIIVGAGLMYWYYHSTAILG